MSNASTCTTTDSSIISQSSVVITPLVPHDSSQFSKVDQLINSKSLQELLENSCTATGSKRRCEDTNDTSIISRTPINFNNFQRSNTSNSAIWKELSEIKSLLRSLLSKSSMSATTHEIGCQTDVILPKCQSSKLTHPSPYIQTTEANDIPNSSNRISKKTSVARTKSATNMESSKVNAKSSHDNRSSPRKQKPKTKASVVVATGTRSGCSVSGAPPQKSKPILRSVLVTNFDPRTTSTDVSSFLRQSNLNFVKLWRMKSRNYDESPNTYFYIGLPYVAQSL